MSGFDLSGMNAIVTGSSRGIGRAIAQAFAAHGANVVISSRKQPACDAVAEAINARAAAGQGGRAVAIAANVGDKQAVADLAQAARAALGEISVLVCNAATNPYYGPMAGISDEAFDKILHTNLVSHHWLIGHLAPAMRARRMGSIILVSSIGGLRGSPVIGAYNIAKAAEMQLARNLAVEFGADAVRVNCIAPGLIRTDFARALWEDETNLAAALRNTPMARIGEPEDIAGAAVFLAAPAARYVTGQVIVVDGGATVTAGGI